MAVQPVLLYPDPRLKQRSSEVAEVSAEITELVNDLIDTMRNAPGCIGISAPQIGALQRIVLIDLSRNPKYEDSQGLQVLINPEILQQEGEVMGREGCLSLPHLTANVKRAKNISLSAKLIDGQNILIEACDFKARVILHEIDHLDGILFLDRVASLKHDVFERKLYFK